MDSVLLMAAMSMGTLAVDSQQKADPAPKKTDQIAQQFGPLPVVLPSAEYIYPLPVAPKVQSRYPNLGEGPPPGLPCRGAARQATFPDRAVLIIRLPPDAEVYFNWYYVRSASDRRAFLTGDLLPDHSYFYDVKVRVFRNFRTYTRFQRVFFRPGEVVEVFFGDVCSSGDLGVPFAHGWY
jgi:uncharacterized protein (TIGR03000 family)